MKPKILILLFVIHLFLMFYNLEKWAPFGWDQVDNAWAAMRIISIHKFPLLGMVAKGNSGIYIGPLYYYFVALFYALTRMDPIAAPIIAGVTSLFSFWVIYFVTKRIMDERVAVVSVAVYTFSSFIITTERVQWPVNFIAPFSLLILYFLYRVITGNAKYFLYLGAIVGLSFHIHFTAIFYPIIVLGAMPLVQWNKVAFKYFLGAIGIGLLFFIPQIIYYLQAEHGQAISGYVASYYHGFHLTRFLQLTPDAFIKFQSILMTPYTWTRYISFLFVPVFLVLHRKKLAYLVALWFLVPWIVFTTYSGEISDYYFSLQSYVAVMILAYGTVRAWDLKYIAAKILMSAFWFYWIVANVQVFFNTNPGNLTENRTVAKTASTTARIIPFTEGDPQSYLYYYYMYRKGGWLPYKL